MGFKMREFCDCMLNAISKMSFFYVLGYECLLPLVLIIIIVLVLIIII